ncbi:MAG: lysine 2,3-aminomutase [Spirochaetales bacterium]|nr:lysine 2,3-aminomutase [Spirochaetales bacterium]
MSIHAPVNPQKVPLYADVPPEDWNDWRWQMRHALRNAEDLGQVIPLERMEKKGMEESLQKFRMAITPYYAALIDQNREDGPIRAQAVPNVLELVERPSDLLDPLSEEGDSPVPGLTHRYPDRVLLLVTRVCAMYCRHCTRRRTVGQEDSHGRPEEIDMALQYISSHEEIRDVLISGGDPFTLSTERLESILSRLRAIPHVEIIRIGSRTPVVLPQRITPAFAAMLSRYQPLYVNTHFNHYKEITAESAQACANLANAGIPLGNQSVLLKGVNDCPRIMKKLVHELLKIRVKPYYIYQCDLSMGIGHFRTSIAKGEQIIESLRGHTTGMAVPTFVVDAPGGGGKIPVMPNYVLSHSDRHTVLRNYEGVITTYTEPDEPYSECHCELCREASPSQENGVAGLLQDDRLSLEPTVLQRRRRNGSS